MSADGGEGGESGAEGELVAVEIVGGVDDSVAEAIGYVRFWGGLGGKDWGEGGEVEAGGAGS